METENSILMLILAFILILLNAFFVLAEFSIVKVRKSKLEELAKENVSNAKLACNITSSLDTYLSASQLGITISSLALGWIGEPVVSRLITLPLYKYFHLDPIFIHTISFVVAFIIITLLHVVLGELVPKSIAIAKSEKSVLFIARPFHLFWVIFSPIIKIFDFFAIITLRIIGIKKADDSELALSEEEIKIIAGESLKGGILDSFENEIIQNAVDFSDTVAKEIMTPRKDMICLDKQNTIEENMKIIHDASYTRFPYIDDSKDSVIGLIHIRDILRLSYEKKELNLDDIVRKLIIIPESCSISNALVMMNKERIPAALVVDEYGGTAGFVTVEDIIEEIVGDMNDEHDQEYEGYKKIAENIFEFQGRCELETVEEVLDIEFNKDFEQLTIGGYVFSLLERLPIVGDKIEDENCFYQVMKMDGTSIKTLKIRKKLPIEEKID